MNKHCLNPYNLRLPQDLSDHLIGQESILQFFAFANDLWRNFLLSNHGHWQPECKRTALAHLTLHADFSAHQFDNFIGDR